MRFSKLILFCLILFFGTACNDESSISNCGKSFYEAIENNPALSVGWIKKMINEAENSKKTHEILWYKLDQKDYFASYFYYDIHKKESISQRAENDDIRIPPYIYDAEGEIYYSNVNPSEEDMEKIGEFYKNAELVSRIWYYNSCYEPQEDTVY